VAPRAPAASEDCLFLNVWTSANRASDRRPVMVWIYGGGFTGGSGSDQWYDGEALAAKGPVIVTMNYRLGSLGFFAHPELAKESGRNASGNYGMMDALATLRWVKANIANFGGDPNNVTIFGESAGAIMIGAIVGSPEAKGLFHRAIAQSGAWMGLQMGRMTPASQALANGAKATEAAGVKSIAELRARPLAELPALGGAGLVIDGYLIPEDLSITFAAGRQNNVDILAGSNKDENTLFGGGGRGGGRGGGAAAAPVPGAAVQAYVAQARQRYGDLADMYLKLYPAGTDDQVAQASAQLQNDEINWNMRQFAAAQSKVGKKAYSYFFTRVPLQNGQPQANGATHTAEISYAFNHPFRGGATLEWNDVDRKLADQMSSYWVNFATKGDPNGPGLPAWPRYTALATSKVMVLGDTVHVEATPPAPKMAFFDALYARLMQGN
jgi:para-nitrobenzyl esterase